ncbi:MAG: TerB family tellurite resistance protein [Gammaproteobacteria bacterium]|nr:TerB family tellurite resistance protein [Gammaproteobacteria bacterium]
MGLISDFGGQPDTTLTPKAALLLSAITMTAIDGKIDDDEIAIISRLDDSGNTDAWDIAISTWKLNSVDQCIALVAVALDEKQQLVALANMVDIALANGSWASAEKDLLAAYCSAFNLQSSDVDRVMEVIAIKNDKSLF